NRSVQQSTSELAISKPSLRLGGREPHHIAFAELAASGPAPPPGIALPLSAPRRSARMAFSTSKGASDGLSPEPIHQLHGQRAPSHGVLPAGLRRRADAADLR